MENKLETIRQSCIKANPSIMELGFGCELEAKDYKMRYVGFNNNQHAIFVVRNSAMLFVDKLGEGTEILGRPIRLTDVLLAINESKKDFMGDWQVNTRGHFCKWLINGQNISQAESWNLLKDDLREQSEETIDFLFNLLK